MCFYSLYQARYLKFSLFHALAFMLTGPIAAKIFGFVELAVFYILIVFIPANLNNWILFHCAYVLFGLAVLPLLLRVRRYRRTELSEVYGRFPRRNSVWP